MPRKVNPSLAKLANSHRGRANARDTSTWADKERRLLAACHPKQRGFVEDRGRRIAALVARGGAKGLIPEAIFDPQALRK